MLGSTFVKRTTCAIVFAAAATAGSAALAAPAFSFRTVEFLPADQREAAVGDFMQHNVVQGMPLAQAVAALQSAGAYCHAPRDGEVNCIHSFVERPIDHGLLDVVWRVRLTAAQGAVTAATVRHTVAGI
jgi:hypothetical protein